MLKKGLDFCYYSFQNENLKKTSYKANGMPFFKRRYMWFCGLGNSEYNLTYVCIFLHDVEKH